jgi:hypothetical protein
VRALDLLALVCLTTLLAATAAFASDRPRGVRIVDERGERSLRAVDAPLESDASKSLSFPPIGGVDGLVDGGFIHTDLVTRITSSGTIYVAAELSDIEFVGSGIVVNEVFLRVYRSTDGGTNFDVWGVLRDPTSDATEYRLEDFAIAEGDVDRAYVAFEVVPEFAPPEMLIARCDLTPDPAIWTFDDPFGDRDVRDVRLATDAAYRDDYRVYALAVVDPPASSGRLQDLWFTRAVDTGEAWSTPYAIQFLTDTYAFGPSLEVGPGGVVHVAYTAQPLGTPDETDVMYLRATNAAASPFDWSSSATALTPPGSGVPYQSNDMAVSSLDGSVLLAYQARSSGWWDKQLIHSADAGLTWSAPGPSFRSRAFVDLEHDPTDDRFVVGAIVEESAVIASAPAASPTVLGPWVRFSDVTSGVHNDADVALDPSRGHDVAIAFERSILPGHLLFDAEWRDDITFPRDQPGFPLIGNLADAPRDGAAPALFDIDDDGDREIVFHDGAMTIRAVDPDGTMDLEVDLTDFFVSSDVITSNLAVGELTPGQPAIVVHTQELGMLAIGADGSALPGFPVAVPEVVLRLAVAPLDAWRAETAIFGTGVGGSIVRVSATGEVAAPFVPTDFERAFPPAIGDLNGDGTTELVSVARPSGGDTPGVVDVFASGFADGAPSPVTHPLSDEPSDGPSLADLDADGDLEIIVPLANGDVEAFHHDFTDVSGFPYDRFDLNGPASPGRIGIDVLGRTEEPSLFMVGRDGILYVLTNDGQRPDPYPVVGYPGSDTASEAVAARVERSESKTLVYGANDLVRWAVRAVDGQAPDGWPGLLQATIDYTPAVGDIDRDFRDEIVFIGEFGLHVLEVGTTGSDAGWWTMAGGDAGRTGCAGCYDRRITGVDASPADDGALALRLASGHPARGAAEFAFSLDRPGRAELRVFDLRGRLVRSIERPGLGAGSHTVVFDGRDRRGVRLANGAYVAQLVVDGSTEVRRAHRKFVWLDH